MRRQSRRDFLGGSVALAGLGVLAGCGITSSKPVPKARLVGWLSGNTTPGSSGEAAMSAFREGLRDLGYVEGENLILERRSANSDDRYTEPVAELLRLQPEVIVVPAAQEARAVRAATTTIPIVNILGDLVTSGLAVSLAKPGGNVTGLSTPSLAAKQLQVLHEAIPALARVVVLIESVRSPEFQREPYEVAAHTMGLMVQFESADATGDLAPFFEAAIRGHADALVVTMSPGISANQSRIADLAMQRRLPSLWQQTEGVSRGGLLGYGANRNDLYRRAATYVDKILKGAKPGDLPVEQPTKFDFVINLKTAQALGLTIPPSVLQQATEVIQ